MAETAITADDPYRRNPARDVERFAVRLVESWVGDRGVVEDLSAGHDPDFRIRYRDGRLGWGEVGWHEDGDLRAMWSVTFRREKHQQVDLPAGVGAWVVSLVKGASIKQLYKDLPSFVSELARLGCTRLSIIDRWPRGEPADTARRLGIEYINRTRETPDVAVFFMPGSGGAIPSDPDVITDWISEVLADADYADTTRKLLAHEAEERHVFLMAGSRTPFGVDERLRRLTEAIPTRTPELSNGITHVWTTSQFGDGPAGLWTRGHGWSLVPLPPLDENGS